MRFAIVILLSLITGFQPVFGQSVGISGLFSFEQFIKRVNHHHPIAIQANLQADKGDAYVLKSRGAFDPKLLGDVSQKYFDGTTYYQNALGGLKIPTWFGIELQAMVTRGDGYYLNPQNTTPTAGLYSAGISIPVGQGLLIDERRTELKKAKAYREATIAERNKITNQLLYEAGKEYWDWYQSFRVFQVYEEALLLTSQRFNQVLQGARSGERPYVDTLEAGIQVQTRRLSVEKAKLQFQNSTSRLAVFLWDEGLIPLEPAAGTIPDTNQIPSYDTKVAKALLLRDSLLMNHPELIKQEYGISMLEFEKRWKAEQLKPEVRLKYNALSEPINGFPGEYDPNNYTWGVGLNFPVLLRKERGNLKLANIDLEMAGTELMYTKFSLEQYTTQAVNNWTGLDRQMNVYARTVDDYGKLLEAERTMFRIGESSLFLVNMREVGFIRARISWYELQAKYRMSELQVLYSMGSLPVFVQEL